MVEPSALQDERAIAMIIIYRHHERASRPRAVRGPAGGGGVKSVGLGTNPAIDSPSRGGRRRRPTGPLTVVS